MTGFAADWLTLRAPADARARNRRVALALRRAMAGRRGLRVLDLGAGTGNNMAATGPLLPPGQHWSLVDSDAALLARARPRRGATLSRRTADLAEGIGALLTPLPDLVTASAFFDLAGGAWIEALAAELARRRLPLYTVLSYTGVEEWAPPHPQDAVIRDAFHADQRRDKGLGPALGPEAHAALRRALQSAGYRIVEGASDWVLESGRDSALIDELAQGTGRALAPRLGQLAEEWGGARRRASRVRISHADLLALPPV